MKFRPLHLLFLTGMLTVLSMNGCVFQRRIVRMAEHPTQPVLLLETDDITRLFSRIYRIEHIYWQCVERNGALACQRQCGGSREFECPTLTTNGANVPGEIP